MFTEGDLVQITQGKYSGQAGVINGQASAPIAARGRTYRIRLNSMIKEVWCYEHEIAKEPEAANSSQSATI